MKIITLLLLISLSLLAKPTVLIITAKSSNNTLKEKARNAVEKEMKVKYKNYKFTNKIIDFDNKDSINKLQDYINKNIDNLVYIVAPKNTSEYKAIASVLPKKVPIITSVGTALVLNKKDSWVVTTSALSKGKAIAIKNLIHKNTTQDIVVLYDSEIDDYTAEIIQYLLDFNIKMSFMDINEIEPQELKVTNRLIFVAAKTNPDTKRIYDKINEPYLIKHNIMNDLLFLKVSQKDKSYFNYQSNIYYLAYDIPGYLPDFRLKLFKNVKKLCDLKNSTITRCYQTYGKEYKSLHMFLDLGLNAIKKDDKTNSIRENIYKKLINYDKTNIYYNKDTKQIVQFKKNNNFYYSSLIEEGIKNYYIVKLDKNKDYLNDFQINTKESSDKSVKSQITVYLDFKLEKLLVTDLSASGAYIEGIVRIVSTNKDINFKKDFHINFDNNSLEQSSIKLIDKNKYIDNAKELYESFYLIKGYFNIESKLMNFPFDKQKVYINFAPEDFVNNHFVVQLQENDSHDINFGEWSVDYIKPFLSNDIVTFRRNALIKTSSVFYKPVSNLEIQISRQTSFAILMKFVLPVVIILFLIGFTYFSYHKNSSLDSSVDIYVSSFAGIMSVYFIFNLLIDIENLIWFDIGFLLVMFISTIVILLNMHRKVEEIENSK